MMAEAVTTGTGLAVRYEPRARPPFPPSLAVFSVYAALYLAAGWLVTFKAHFFIGDTLARTANAYYVLYSRDPHLAAVGFAWLPLPSFMQLPFIVLLRPFGATLYSGAITTALLSAANVLLVRRIVRQIGVRGPSGVALTAIYGLNPFVILYAANGMSEASFLTTVLLATTGLLAWRDNQQAGPLLGAGLACGIAWGIRFESVGLVAAGAATIIAVWWSRFRDDNERLEGELIAFLVPFTFAVALWLLASWLITGSPFYFLHGAGNSAAQSIQSLRHSHSPVVALYHHAALSFEYVLVRCAWFMPALLPLLAVCLARCLSRGRGLELLTLLPPVPILLLHALLLYELQSYGEFRYYCYALPLGIFAAALVLAASPTTRPGGRHRSAVALAVVAATALSIPSTLLAMTDSSLGRQEQPLVQLALGRTSPQISEAQWTGEQRVALHLDYLRLPDGSVVLDTTAGFPIVLFSHHPRQFIVSSDSDFDPVFQQLSQFHGYILVSANPNHPSSFVQTRYPGLLSGAPPGWARLIYRSGYWLLYRIHTVTAGS